MGVGNLMLQRRVAKKWDWLRELIGWQQRVVLRSRCLSHFFRGATLWSVLKRVQARVPCPRRAAAWACGAGRRHAHGKELNRYNIVRERKRGWYAGSRQLGHGTPRVLNHPRQCAVKWSTNGQQ